MVIPVTIYVLSYLLFPVIYPGKVEGISGLIEQTKNMFEYHSKLTAGHDFSSKWYTWPVMYKPVWYYVGYFGGNIKSTIVGIGNPAIWWFGIIASLYVLVMSTLKRNKENLFIITFIGNFIINVIIPITKPIIPKTKLAVAAPLVFFCEGSI